MDIDTVFSFYRSEFVPAYSDLVGYIGDKPQDVVIELENVLSHISHYFNPEIDKEKVGSNLHKANDHLHRVTLDCYKLLWVNIHEELKIIEDDKYLRKLGLNISEADFILRLQNLRELAQEARRLEMQSVGLDPMASIDKYKEVVSKSHELIKTVDENKKREIKSLKRFITTKEFIVGIITGIVSGYVLCLLFP